MNLTSWKQAREVLCNSGRGVNEAQDILEDLAHWGAGVRSFTCRTGERLCQLSYAGHDGNQQPQYEQKEVVPPA